MFGSQAPLAGAERPDRRSLQRRTLRVLVAAQILAGLGGSGAAAGALLAVEITGDETLASLPLAMLVGAHRPRSCRSPRSRAAQGAAPG